MSSLGNDFEVSQRAYLGALPNLDLGPSGSTESHPAACARDSRGQSPLSGSETPRATRCTTYIRFKRWIRLAFLLASPLTNGRVCLMLTCSAWHMPQDTACARDEKQQRL